MFVTVSTLGLSVEQPVAEQLGGRGGGVVVFFFCLFWMMLKSLTQHYGNKVLT